jgi:hypothetical protein
MHEWMTDSPLFPSSSGRLNSLFHPAIILSILGQAAIHIACMTLAVQWATEAMGPDLLKASRVCQPASDTLFVGPVITRLFTSLITLSLLFSIYYGRK